MPQVIYQGGPLLTAPKIVTVTFPGDALAMDLESFGQSVASSAWWDTVRVGYCGGSTSSCVGDGPPGAFVELSTAAAPSYTDSDQGGASTLQLWLSGAIADGTLPRPDVNAVSNTVFVIYVPDTTMIEFDGMKSCVDGGFEGYHNAMALGSQQVVYAVVVECNPLPPPLPSVAQMTALESMTIAASHEIVEVATDPSLTNTGYYLDLTDTSNWGWLDIAGGGELADLCVDPFGLRQDETTDGAFTVQRVWSNAQAAAGLDPCTPLPAGQVYFNAAPRKSLFVVDVGASTTFDVDAFSGGPMSNWMLSAQDWSNSVTTTYLAFSIAGGMQTDAGPEILVNSGSTVQVTVTLLQDPGQLDTQEADGAIVSIFQESGASPAAHWWPFVVMSTADAADAGISQALRIPHLHQPPRVHRIQRGSHPFVQPALR